jgi:hypothetical protein
MVSIRSSTYELDTLIPCRTCVNSTANELELSVAPARLHTPIADVCRRDTYLLGACPHEIWLRLHLDDLDWISFKKFTLRVSWPASVRSKL